MENFLGQKYVNRRKLLRNPNSLQIRSLSNESPKEQERTQESSLPKIKYINSSRDETVEYSRSDSPKRKYKTIK